MSKKIKLPKGLDIEDLRFRRDLAKKDGDFQLAFACALAIDEIKYGVHTKKAEGKGEA